MVLSLEVKSILHHATETSHMWINTFVNSYFSSWLFRSHKNITIVTAHKPTLPLVGNVFWSGRCPLCNFGGAPTREDWRRLIMSGADPRFLKRGWLSWWFQIPPAKCRKLRTGFKFKTVTLDRNTAMSLTIIVKSVCLSFLFYFSGFFLIVASHIIHPLESPNVCCYVQILLVN